jgi:hypothetical protein
VSSFCKKPERGEGAGIPNMQKFEFERDTHYFWWSGAPDFDLDLI